MKDCKIGSWKLVDAHRMNLFKSVLLIPPIGLISALLQSYFVTKSRISQSRFKAIDSTHNILLVLHQRSRYLTQVNHLGSVILGS